MRIFVAEWMKTRHTILHRLVLLIPLFCSLAVLGYAAYRKNSFSLAFFYQGFFLIWSAVLLPLGVGILTGILVHEEEEAGNFYGLLQCSRKRSSLYLGKFSAALVFLTGSTFLTTLIISTGLCFLLQKERGVGLFLTAACLAVCGVLPVLAVHLWVSFAFGMGASVGVGICGLLLAVLLGSTSLGDHIWYAVPWTYPVKMAMFPMAFSMFPENMRTEAEKPFVLAFALSLVLSVLILAGSMLWFEKWEGRGGNR